MRERGLNPAQVARETGVTRAAVSKWFKGKDFPRPNKLLKLGTLLGLTFKELVIEQPDAFEPVIAFRRKGGRKTTEAHIERAKHMGMLLGALAPLLPFDPFLRPATLKSPKNDYGYLQLVAHKIRAEIGVQQDAPVQFRDLVGKFKSLQAVLIPVLWGHKDHHENALDIYLPASMTTWVYLNLNSNVHDFKFWMAHELGHVYAPDLRDDEAEDFADAFAQVLLFPDECAVRAYATVKRARSKGARINRMKDIAREFGLSPTTVNLALQAYAREQQVGPVDVGDAIHPASRNFNKEFPAVSQTLFTQEPPSPSDYIKSSRDVFRSPFFDVLQKHVRQESVSAGFLETVLQLPLLDARGIIEELR